MAVLSSRLIARAERSGASARLRLLGWGGLLVICIILILILAAFPDLPFLCPKGSEDSCNTLSRNNAETLVLAGGMFGVIGLCMNFTPVVLLPEIAFEVYEDGFAIVGPGGNTHSWANLDYYTFTGTVWLAGSTVISLLDRLVVHTTDGESYTMGRHYTGRASLGQAFADASSKLLIRRLAQRLDTGQSIEVGKLNITADALEVDDRRLARNAIGGFEVKHNTLVIQTQSMEAGKPSAFARVPLNSIPNALAVVGLLQQYIPVTAKRETPRVSGPVAAIHDNSENYISPLRVFGNLFLAGVIVFFGMIVSGYPSRVRPVDFTAVIFMFGLVPSLSFALFVLSFVLLRLFRRRHILEIHTDGFVLHRGKQILRYRWDELNTYEHREEGLTLHGLSLQRSNKLTLRTSDRKHYVLNNSWDVPTIVGELGQFHPGLRFQGKGVAV